MKELVGEAALPQHQSVLGRAEEGRGPAGGAVGGGGEGDVVGVVQEAVGVTPQQQQVHELAAGQPEQAPLQEALDAVLRHLLVVVHAEGGALEEELRGGLQGEVHVHHLLLRHAGQVGLALPRVLRHRQQSAPHLTQPPEGLANRRVGEKTMTTCCII